MARFAKSLTAERIPAAPLTAHIGPNPAIVMRSRWRRHLELKSLERT